MCDGPLMEAVVRVARGRGLSAVGVAAVWGCKAIAIMKRAQEPGVDDPDAYFRKAVLEELAGAIPAKSNPATPMVPEYIGLPNEASRQGDSTAPEMPPEADRPAQDNQPEKPASVSLVAEICGLCGSDGIVNRRLPATWCDCERGRRQRRLHPDYIDQLQRAERKFGSTWLPSGGTGREATEELQGILSQKNVLREIPTTPEGVR